MSQAPINAHLEKDLLNTKVITLAGLQKNVNNFTNTLNMYNDGNKLIVGWRKNDPSRMEYSIHDKEEGEGIIPIPEHMTEFAPVLILECKTMYRSGHCLFNPVDDTIPIRISNKVKHIVDQGTLIMYNVPELPTELPPVAKELLEQVKYIMQGTLEQCQKHVKTMNDEMDKLHAETDLIIQDMKRLRRTMEEMQPGTKVDYPGLSYQ